MTADDVAIATCLLSHQHRPTSAVDDCFAQPASEKHAIEFGDGPRASRRPGRASAVPKAIVISEVCRTSAPATVRSLGPDGGRLKT
jgi:hypothetical protein